MTNQGLRSLIITIDWLLMLHTAFSPSVGRTSSLRTRPRLHSACALQLIGRQATGWAAAPTAEQQYGRELTNRFRSDPSRDLAKLANFSSPGVWDTPKSNDAHIAYALNLFGTSAADLVAQTFRLDAPVENDGAPETFYDNVYSSFMAVPEPGSLLLCLVAALHAQAFRSRLQST